MGTLGSIWRRAVLMVILIIQVWVEAKSWQQLPFLILYIQDSGVAFFSHYLNSNYF